MLTDTNGDPPCGRLTVFGRSFIVRITPEAAWLKKSNLSGMIGRQMF